MTQDEIVTETTSANTQTLKEIDFSRNKESLVLGQSSTWFPLSVPISAFLGEKPWRDRKWRFFFALVCQRRLKLFYARSPSDSGEIAPS